MAMAPLEKLRHFSTAPNDGVNTTIETTISSVKNIVLLFRILTAGNPLIRTNRLLKRYFNFSDDLTLRCYICNLRQLNGAFNLWTIKSNVRGIM